MQTSLQPTVIRARWVVPILTPPIHNAIIEVEGGRIQRVRPVRDDDDVQLDLGDVAILPGLVNAHTHLEFSDLQQPLGKPQMPLAEWIGQVISYRQSVPHTGPEAIGRGLQKSWQSGTVLLGEIATTPWPGSAGIRINDTDIASEVEIFSFAEVLGLDEQRGRERLGAATGHLKNHNQPDRHWFAGVSPHAPYSTPLWLIERCVELAQRYSCPLAMHVAESADERELLCSGGGRFRDQLQSIGLHLDGLFPWPQQRPFEYLIDLLARAPRALLVHGNDLQPEEIHRLAEHPHLSVVMCPRTHRYFGHPPHPIAELLRNGVNVALGTDSLASNPDLSLWKEVQFLMNQRTDLAPDLVLRLATWGGATALGRTTDYGSLRPGTLAQFIQVPTNSSTLAGLLADFATLPHTPQRWIPTHFPNDPHRRG